MSRLSGVVCSVGRTSPAMWVSIVPRRTLLRPTLARSCSSRNVVVVLPFVPVTALSFSLRSGWPKTTALTSASARRPCSTSAIGSSGCDVCELIEHFGGVGHDCRGAVAAARRRRTDCRPWIRHALRRRRHQGQRGASRTARRESPRHRGRQSFATEAPR